MGLVILLAVVIAAIYGGIYMKNKNKLDKAELRKRELEIEKKERELKK